MTRLGLISYTGIDNDTETKKYQQFCQDHNNNNSDSSVLIVFESLVTLFSTVSKIIQWINMTFKIFRVGNRNYGK